MNTQTACQHALDRTLRSASGMEATVLATGAIADLFASQTRINLKPGYALSNFYLRRWQQGDFQPLFGPQSTTQISIGSNSLTLSGQWQGIDFSASLQLCENQHSAYWRIDVSNQGNDAAELDIIYLQDVGLQPREQQSVNGYYVSQYVERRILQHPRYGKVLCCRQNGEGDSNPWLMLAAEQAVSACTDGMQIFGPSYRANGIPEGLLTHQLAGELSGESSIVALQNAPFTLVPQQSKSLRFISHFIADHPDATSEQDLAVLDDLFHQSPLPPKDQLRLPAQAASLFESTALLPSEPLTDAHIKELFGEERRHSESKGDELLSFFTPNTHVVLQAKELRVDRPHGHILQAALGTTPSENTMASTVSMQGVFNSQLCQGNTNFNRLLSVSSCPFNLHKHSGQRIFVDLDGQRYLLGVPSAFEIGLNHCRWIYQLGDYRFQVRSWASVSSPIIYTDFSVLAGGSVNLLVSHHLHAENDWQLSPADQLNEAVLSPRAGLIAERFPDAFFHMQWDSDGQIQLNEQVLMNHNPGDSFVTLKAEGVTALCISFIGEVLEPLPNRTALQLSDIDRLWQRDNADGLRHSQQLLAGLTLQGDQADWAALQQILPWYAANASVHYLTPFGLEQIDGAAWGTRDTAQGPMELLLATGHYAEAKQVLRTLFSHQDTDGGWPQWWMFDSYKQIRHNHSHADIHHWCLIALCSYLEASGDRDFLDEALPYFGAASEQTVPLREHVSRLITMLTNSFLENTHLVPFGGGDWNDAMQPVDDELASRMVSTWTVELSYQGFRAWKKVCEQFGDQGQAAEMEALCNNIRDDFNRHLVRDSVVSGHGLRRKDGDFDLLLHPSDQHTGIHYRLLPMMRGIISGIFTREQTQHHLELIETHLKGPDGARLMNRPPKYQGGIQSFFKRAESSPFFGREVGLMYTHAHLRYAEVQARVGRPDALLKALRQAIPVDYQAIVPTGNLRQSNCYYSSSDVSFANRSEAEQDYQRVIDGKIETRGGWRVYSSGPGMYVGMIITRLLGLRESFGKTIIDPVISRELDGMSATIEYRGKLLCFEYCVSDTGVSPQAIEINGKAIDFAYEKNPYRAGGALLKTKDLLSWLTNSGENHLKITL